MFGKKRMNLLCGGNYVLHPLLLPSVCLKKKFQQNYFKEKVFPQINWALQKRYNIGDLCVDKKILPPKTLLHFFFYLKTPLHIFMARNSPFLRKNFNFKPHNETCLCLWCGLCRQSCTGGKRTWASTTLREVAWCIIPGWAGDQSLFGKEATLIERKDN